jgi:5-methylcytosine-specific restriction enzyme B
LEQAKTNNLKTKHFDHAYNGLEVKVSFGQGNTAKIPWISFLKKPNTTSNGIYPVYLYYKDFEILILAYGVSETNAPKSNWKITDKQSISEYFSEIYSQKPDRYGSSFVFKVYDVKDMPSPQELDNDLSSILGIYSKHSDYKIIEDDKIKDSKSKFMLEKVLNNISKSGLAHIAQISLTRAILSLIFHKKVLKKWFLGYEGLCRARAHLLMS